MQHNWRMFVLPAFLTAALASPACYAEAQGTAGDRVKQMQDQLERMNASIKKAFEKVGDDMKTLRTERAEAQTKIDEALGKVVSLDRTLADLKSELEALKKRLPAAGSLDKAGTEEIRTKLGQIEQTLARMQAPGRVALSPPATSESADGHHEKVKAVQEQLDLLNASLKRAFEKVAEDMKGLKEDRADAQVKLQTTLSTLNALQRQVADMRTDLDALRRRLPADISLYAPEKASLDDIRSRLTQIEQGLLRLQTAPRVANFPPVASGLGRIVLANNTVEELLYIVNGRSYRVAPGAAAVLDAQPPGPFSYEVISPTWGVRGRNTPTLAPRETFTISVP
jgi:septal ring factor EnvC (AmiA/AmiB activator)